MKIELDGGALHDTLRAAIYKPRSTLPILSFALLDAAGERVRITTTDTEAYFIADLPAKVPANGRICVNIELLRAAAREGRLALLHNDDSGIMQAAPKGGSKLRLPVLDADDFPEPDHGNWKPLDVDGAELATALRLVGYAAGHNNAYAFANLVALVPGAVAATDTHRAAKYTIAYNGPQIAIPEGQIDSVLAQLGPDAKLSYTSNAAGQATMLRVENGERTLIVRLIAAELPQYENVFTGIDQRDRRALFDRVKLLQAVKQFMPFTAVEGIPKASFKGAYLDVQAGGAKLEIFENEENCSWALSKHDGDIRFSLSMHYLADVLSVIDTERVWIGHVKIADQFDRLTIEPDIPGAEVLPHAHIIVGMTL